MCFGDFGYFGCKRGTCCKATEGAPRMSITLLAEVINQVGRVLLITVSYVLIKSEWQWQLKAGCFHLCFLLHIVTKALHKIRFPQCMDKFPRCDSSSNLIKSGINQYKSSSCAHCDCHEAFGNVTFVLRGAIWLKTLSLPIISFQIVVSHGTLRPSP